MGKLPTSFDLADEAIFERTAKGQLELVWGSAGLSHWERRFLGCATGFTSLRALLDLGLDGPEAISGICRLLEAGMIRRVQGPEGAGRRPQIDRVATQARA